MVVSLRFKETGSVTTYQPNGRKGVRLGAVSDGGAIAVFNKTGDPIIDLHPGRIRQRRGRRVEPHRHLFIVALGPIKIFKDEYS